MMLCSWKVSSFCGFLALFGYVFGNEYDTVDLIDRCDLYSIVLIGRIL